MIFVTCSSSGRCGQGPAVSKTSSNAGPEPSTSGSRTSLGAIHCQCGLKTYDKTFGLLRAHLVLTFCSGFCLGETCDDACGFPYPFHYSHYTASKPGNNLPSLLLPITDANNLLTLLARCVNWLVPVEIEIYTFLSKTD